MDGFEIGCDNGERVRVAFALDCCDREAMSFLATTSGVSGEDVRDLMVAAVEHRFGLVNRSIACRSPPSGCPTMVAVTSPTRHAGSLATSASNGERRQSKVHRAMEWLKPSSVRSNIRPGEKLNGSYARTVDAFVEKPDAVTAANYVADRYLWNGGNFLFHATMLLEVERFEPARAIANAEQAL
jgi:hypothetical protein